MTAPTPDEAAALADAETYTRAMAERRKHHGALAAFVAEYDRRAAEIAALRAEVERLRAVPECTALCRDIEQDRDELRAELQRVDELGRQVIEAEARAVRELEAENAGLRTELLTTQQILAHAERQRDEAEARLAAQQPVIDAAVAREAAVRKLCEGRRFLGWSVESPDGSSVFGTFPTEARAERAADDIRRTLCPDARIVESYGPAALDPRDVLAALSGSVEAAATPSQPNGIGHGDGWRCPACAGRMRADELPHALRVVHEAHERAREAADTPPSGTSGHEADTPAEPECCGCGCTHQHQPDPTLIYGPGCILCRYCSCPTGHLAREVAGTPAAEPAMVAPHFMTGTDRPLFVMISPALQRDEPISPAQITHAVPLLLVHRDDPSMPYWAADREWMPEVSR